MTTQYGFLSIPAAVLAVKPANWRAKILKLVTYRLKSIRYPVISALTRPNIEKHAKLCKPMQSFVCLTFVPIPIRIHPLSSLRNGKEEKDVTARFDKSARAIAY